MPRRYRVNVGVGRARFTELIGESPREFGSSDTSTRDFGQPDMLLPHPVYGRGGWIAVVNPAERTMPTLVELLRNAHERQRRHVQGS